MKIPFADLSAQHSEVRAQITAAITRVLEKSDFILGEDVLLFEQEFARYCQARYAVGVSSGTAAIFLALVSHGIRHGDEVIVPDFTYIATALAVSYTGARPVLVDIDEDSYNIDAAKIKKAITRKTKAVIPVHLYGQPANMQEVMKLANQYGLKVIEDAAQAHGAAIAKANTNAAGGNRWRRTGSIGDIGCFSFYPSKNLGALGDGGMVTTDNPDIYEKLRMLRDYGRVSKYEHAIVGYNSRLDTLQAAVLRVKLKRLDRWNAMRRKVARLYDKSVAGCAGIVVPHVDPGLRHVYHVYAIRTPKRAQVIDMFKRKGIAAIIHYPIPIHLQKAYAFLGGKPGDFPVSERVAGEILSLPMYPHMKEEHIAYVASAIKAAVGGG